MSADLSLALLEFVLRPQYRPLKPRVIAKKLELDAGATRELRLVIKKLAQRGLVTYGEKHLVLPPADPAAAREFLAKHRVPGTPAETAPAASPTKPSRQAPPQRKPTPPAAPARDTPPAAKKSIPHDGRHISGVFRRTMAGNGFVRPSNAQPGADRSGDVYIARDDSLDAASGDVVLVKLNRRRGGEDDHAGERRAGSGRSEGGARERERLVGRIVEVLERETNRFVGTYFETTEGAFARVDGKLFAAPINVGDAGAKGVRPDDKIVIEMVRFPSHWHDGEGVIVEVLGARGAPGVDTLSIIHEYNLPGEFPDDVLQEARRAAEEFDEGDLSHRRDLTGETTVTIDPVDARDFDDAISLTRIENDHWRLGVHIADVSHFVRPGTALDREAYDRATSVYLPDRVIPMLPEIISNALASLQPHKVRYTQTAILEFTPDGAFVSAEFCRSAIRSDRRFTYEEVDEYLAHRAAWKTKIAPEVHALLARMHELAMILRRRRMERGSLELTMPEVKIDLDRDGRVSGAHVVESTESHQIIEEFMLAANEAAARRLAETGRPFLRRVHQAPDPRKLKQLSDFVVGLGVTVDEVRSRFDLQGLLAKVRGQPEEAAVNYALLRSLARAVYSPVDEGHYALASDCYTHFTSPIRRYPDLTVHRMLDALFDRKKPRGDDAELVAQGEHCSERERRAEDAERELTKLKLLTFLEARVGQEISAVITGVEEFGVFARGVELPAEGLIHVTALPPDRYRFDRKAHVLEGFRPGNNFRLGDLIRVEVARVDVDGRSLDFRLASREGKRPETASRGDPVKGDPFASRRRPASGRAKATGRAESPPSRRKSKAKGLNRPAKPRKKRRGR